MIIDSHMHCNNSLLNSEEIIKEINENKDISGVINVGLNIEVSKQCVNIANSNSKFYVAIGIHPLYIDNEDCKQLYSLNESDKVVAIGEIGLDSSHNNFEDQKKYLIRQIMIANELRLPVIIHANNTNKEVIEIFQKYVKPKYGCVFHCFQPDIETLKFLVTNGYYVSFAGKITYKTAKKSLEIISLIPDSLFLVETDSPYIPIGLDKEILSSTSNISYIIEKIAQVKDYSYDEIEKITIENTKRLFKKIKSN